MEEQGVRIDECSPLLPSAHDDQQMRKMGEGSEGRSMTLRILCLFCSVLFAVTGASITTFPLYGPYFVTDLGFTQSESNAISSGVVMSIYITMPIWGFLGTKVSPGIVALISTGFSVSGYLVSSASFSDSKLRASHGDMASNFPYILAAFIMIGSATSAVLLSCLAACSISFGLSKHKGFLLAVPVASFGLGGIVFSQLASWAFILDSGPGHLELNVPGYFRFLAAALITVGPVTARVFHLCAKELDTAKAPIESSRSSSYDDQEVYGELTDREMEDGIESKRLNLGNLVKDPILWWLAGGYFLIAGPCEVYQNNLGNIVRTIMPSTMATPMTSLVSQQLSTIAASSTIARFSMGILCDRLHSHSGSSRAQNTPPFLRSRFIILVIPPLFAVAGFLKVATISRSESTAPLYISSVLLGFGYGSTFSLIPIVSSIWGAHNMALAWSFIAVAPAPGVGVFGMLYSFLYSRALRHGGLDQCQNWGCYGTFAYKSAVGVMLAIIAWSFAWWETRRRHVVT